MIFTFCIFVFWVWFILDLMREQVLHRGKTVFRFQLKFWEVDGIIATALGIVLCKFARFWVKVRVGVREIPNPK